jgi:hypothetical protein
MHGRRCRWGLLPLAVAALGWAAPPGHAACCYFTAKDKDILQPGQKVFLTWDPKAGIETFTVQPKFTGNAEDFGMVIPTPSRPQLDAMPRSFFKELAVFTILKTRQYPHSKLTWQGMGLGFGGGNFGGGFGGGGFGGFGGLAAQPRRPQVKVLEAGIVGSLDYKIIQAGRADDLYDWLKRHGYHYAGDQATLDFYVKKHWFFTVMRIDTLQMTKDADGSFAGEVTPTRFRFASDRLVYPLRITQISVKDQTEALFYVQAPSKVDLPGDGSYQYQWVPMLLNAQSMYKPGSFGDDLLPGKADVWLEAIQDRTAALMERGQGLGFGFTSGKRPGPNVAGRIPTTLEWAKRLTAEDVRVLRGEAPYSEQVPDVDAGFREADVRDPRKGQTVLRTINARLAKSTRERPNGYLVREAPLAEVKQLRVLVGHLQEGQFLTKFRKTFTRGEMADDLVLVSAGLGGAEDRSEYEEVLPTSPP